MYLQMKYCSEVVLTAQIQQSRHPALLSEISLRIVLLQLIMKLMMTMRI